MNEKITDTINMETADIEAIKRLAMAVVLQVKRDYREAPYGVDYVTDQQLDFFGKYGWVWDVLDLDGTVITDEIKRQGRVHT